MSGELLGSPGHNSIKLYSHLQRVLHGFYSMCCGFNIVKGTDLKARQNTLDEKELHLHKGHDYFIYISSMTFPLPIL